MRLNLHGKAPQSFLWNALFETGIDENLRGSAGFEAATVFEEYRCLAD